MKSQYNVSTSSVKNYVDGSNPEYRVSISNGYSEFKSLKENDQFSTFQKRGSRRKIKEFSPRARKNMLKKIFCLSVYPSLFITLTYPSKYPKDSSVWKRHLDNFYRTLRRDFPEAWFFWKLEPQKRGAPHYHLIGELGVRINIALLRKYISQLWYRVCGSNDIKHLLAGTQADFINDSVGKIRAYTCKYIGKAETESKYEEWALPGRFWGIHGRENLPPVLTSVVDLNSKDFSILKRLIRRWLKRLSPSSRKYASRLKTIPSFHILAPAEIIRRLIEFVTGLSLPPPTVIAEQPKPIPRAIYC
ncbi:hypothetical protein KAR91_00885 [Candidatus Pacearchaeota archaeon]|nr:hypothetical protein [Candidatus Pacearchaeota archaeon]